MVQDGVLTIGKVSAPVYNPDQKMKVPDVLFYDNPQVTLQGQWFLRSPAGKGVEISHRTSVLIYSQILSVGFYLHLNRKSCFKDYL